MRTERAFSTLSREFDIKPQVTLVGKISLATSLCTWSPNELAHLLSVIRTQSLSGINFWRIQEAHKEEVDQKTTKAQDRAHHAGTTLGHVVGPT
jgi:hypothetical protein